MTRDYKRTLQLKRIALSYEALDIKDLGAVADIICDEYRPLRRQEDAHEGMRDGQGGGGGIVGRTGGDVVDVVRRGVGISISNKIDERAKRIEAQLLERMKDGDGVQDVDVFVKARTEAMRVVWVEVAERVAIPTILELCYNSKVHPKVRLSSALAIIERAYGKAQSSQVITVEHKVANDLI